MAKSYLLHNNNISDKDELIIDDNNAKIDNNSTLNREKSSKMIKCIS